MAGEWREASLGQLFKVKHGFAFKGEFFTDEPKKTVLVTPGNFAIGGGFQDDKRKYYSGPVPDGYVLSPGQIVVTMTDLSKQSDTLGYAARIPADDNAWLHNQRVGLLVFSSEIPTEPRFVEYLLRTHDYRSWVVGSATGTTVKHTSPSRIESFKVRVPPLDEQRAIAHILGTLDDKIELNRRMNETLEAMARAIFKSWFVDFDPVRAKASGEPPESICRRLGLIPELLALFPDRLVDSELGEIPAGWEWTPIGDQVNIVGGGTPSTKESDYWDGGSFNWTTPKDLSGNPDSVLLKTERKITQKGVEAISSGLLPVGTVLLSSRAPVGYLAIAKVPTAINQGFIAMKCEKLLTPEYILQWANSVMDEIKQRASGTTFAEISKKNFRPIKVVVPTPNVVHEYTSVAKALYDRIALNVAEADSLGEIRDSLLPKLLSGELPVAEAMNE